MSGWEAFERLLHRTAQEPLYGGVRARCILTLNAIHTPVLGPEVVDALAVRSHGFYVDCTVGEGGHAALILAVVEPPPAVLGIDLDEDALGVARSTLARFGTSVTLIHGSYVDMRRLATEAGRDQADGILMDLGLSSLQLEETDRGFSFQREAHLDMRFDRSHAKSAWDVVNRTAERELSELIRALGEEPRARRIASAIVAARPVETTTRLAEVVANAIGGRKGRIHPATRTFQAVRMAVNGELANVRDGLERAVELLGPQGRLVVISYHSLEDRVVKRFMARESRDCICDPKGPICECGHEASLRRVSKKVIKPTEEEIKANPRSRSARMRVAERLRARAGLTKTEPHRGPREEHDEGL